METSRRNTDATHKYFFKKEKENDEIKPLIVRVTGTYEQIWLDKAEPDD